MEDILLKILMIIGLCCIGAGIFLMLPDQDTQKDQTIKTEPVVVEGISDEYFELDFEQLKMINENFVGKLTVGELVYESVVKSDDNMDYTEKNLHMQSYGIGTVFMDYRNTMEDMNLILYGNTVFSEKELRFGPLHNLIDQKSYNQNKSIVFQLEDQERIFEIMAVLHFDLNVTDVDYAITNYTEDQFAAYLNYIEEHNLIETKTELTYKDRLLTLQTDVENMPEVKLVVVAKEVDR